MPRLGKKFGGGRLPGIPLTAIEIELMFGKRNQKEEVVRIDVDWLLGEPSHQTERAFPWFRRLSLSLVCILAFVWCWPYASRHWLNWEWHQQLAHVLGGTTEDVLPIMLAIHELNPKNDSEMVEHLASSDSSQRSIAYRLLEERIQQLKRASQLSPKELADLIETMSSNRIQSPESQWMRAQLVTQLKPLVTRDLPNSVSLIASIEAMVNQGERSNMPPSIATVTPPSIPSKQANKVRLSDHSASESSPSNSSTAPVTQAKFRLSDNTASLQPPTQASVAKPPLQTLTDQASSSPHAKLPDLGVSIPRTNSNALNVASPSIAIQPVDTVMSAADTPVKQSEPSSIKGIEKLDLEKLLPMLNSSQTRIERQAFNELVRRNIPQQKLELAIALAHGENEEKLQAMDAIARDPQSAIPWLAWMASNTDRNVRRHAIALLGSMTDPDAMRRLRELQSKESDAAISDQINQILLASGMANKVVR